MRPGTQQVNISSARTSSSARNVAVSRSAPDDGLGVHVERGQGVVEHQDLRRGQDRAGQRQPLPLTAGQAHALFADPVFEPERQLVDELRGRDLDGLRQLVLGRERPAANRRLSATDIENRVGSSNAVATVCRSADSDSSRMSMPSMRIAPSVTS